MRKKLYLCILKMNVQELTYYPKPSDFSKVTFWDTDFSHIDWKRHASFVIEHVFGYGTEDNKIPKQRNIFCKMKTFVLKSALF